MTSSWPRSDGSTGSTTTGFTAPSTTSRRSSTRPPTITRPRPTTRLESNELSLHQTQGGSKAHDYGDVILPLMVLRRLDQAPTDTKQAVLNRNAQLAEQGIENREPVLRATSKRSFYNTSPLTFDRLLDDEDNVPANLRAYVEAFSPNARDVIEKFGFDAQVDKLGAAGLLYPILARFADVDLHPDRVS